MLELAFEYMSAVVGPVMASIIVFGIVFAIVFGITRSVEITLPMLFVTMVLMDPIAHFPIWVWFIWALVIGWVVGFTIWRQLI